MITQWFPGHMAKTLGEIEKNLKLCDAVIYCLDARAPMSCLNPEIDKIVKNKQIIYCLNKADLANEAETKRFKLNFEGENKRVLIMSAINNNCKSLILKELKSIVASKSENNARKGITKAVRAMVIGVPNTGKSTIINLLAGAKKATTGDKAGVTKQTSWIKAGEFLELLDTPGTLWPSFKDPMVGVKLAIIGSIKNDVVDTTELAFECLKLLKTIAPDELISRYKLSFNNISIKDTETIDIFDEICKNRGFILRKNEFDYTRAGLAILDDYRNARIGKITLDKVK